MSKICKQCQEPKALESFGSDRRTRDGLRKLCEDCRSVSKRSVASRRGKETREQQNGSQGATQALIERTKALSDPRKTFREMTASLGVPTPKLPNVPWPFASNWAMNEEALHTTDSIIIALLRGDILGSQLLLEDVCDTWIDAVAIQSYIIETLIGIVLTDEEKELLIGVSQEMITERITG